MKVKSGFVLHPIAGEYVVVPVGERTTEFSGMLRLNSTGAFLWDRLLQQSDAQSLESALVAEYGISEELAAKAVASFVEQLSAADVVEL